MRLPVKVGPAEEIFVKYEKGVFRQIFRNPEDGIEDEFILFGTTKGSSPSVIFPLTSDLRVVALHHFRYGAARIITETPGGVPLENESPEDLAVREFTEETGYRAGSITCISPEPIFFDPASVTTVFNVFLAVDCVRVGRPTLDREEFAELELIPFEKWLAMIFTGKIIDSKTITATLLALPRLGFRIERSVES